MFFSLWGLEDSSLIGHLLNVTNRLPLSVSQTLLLRHTPFILKISERQSALLGHMTVLVGDWGFRSGLV